MGLGNISMNESIIQSRFDCEQYMMYYITNYTTYEQYKHQSN